MSDTDLELLARYARHRAEDAFVELVRRHLDLVHSAALRQVRSPQLAEEVAQSSFLKLAQHARQLAPDTILSAWLYQVTRREAIDVVRREARRQLREQIATEMNAMNATAADWTHIEPLLDEAMHALDETDRAAVLLRYFENKSLREVGQALGASENAAQKRLTRAVEHLREFFAKRGVGVGASGLVVVISANAVQAAPVGLSVSISSAAVFAGASLAATVTVATQTTMNWINAKSVAAILAAALGAGTATYLVQERKATQLLAENQDLVARQASAANERDAVLATAQSMNDELERLRKGQVELLRLRGEVSQMRRLLESQKPTTPQSQRPNQSVAEAKAHTPGLPISKDQLANAGYATPEAALETYFWAATKGSFDHVSESVSPGRMAEMVANANQEQLEAELKRDSAAFKGIQIIARKALPDQSVELKFRMEIDPNVRAAQPGLPDSLVQPMILIDGQWRLHTGARLCDMAWDEDPRTQRFIQ